MVVSNNIKVKSVSLSISRVVATLGIVICHIISYYTIIPGHDILGHFFNVGVPMFIIISGFLYGKKAILGGGILMFYVKRLIKVYLPVWIFAVVILLVLGPSELWHTMIAILNLQGLNSLIVAGDNFNAGPNLSHTWFVTIILLCYLILPALETAIDKIKPIHIFFMWLAVLILPYVGVSLQFIALFITSYYLSFNQALKRYNYWSLMTCACFAVLLRLVGHRCFDETVLYNDIIVIVSHCILAASIMLFIREWSLRHTKASMTLIEIRAFKFLEKYSFYIYIVHCLIIPVFCKFGIIVASLLFIFITLVLSYALGIVHMWSENRLNQLFFR